MTLEEIKEQMDILAELHSRGVNYNNYKDVLDKAFRMMFKMWKSIYEHTESIQELKEARAKISVEVK